MALPNITKLNLDTRYASGSNQNPHWLMNKTIDNITGYITGSFIGVNNITNIRDTNNNLRLKTFSGTTGTSHIIQCMATLSYPTGNITQE